MLNLLLLPIGIYLVGVVITWIALTAWLWNFPIDTDVKWLIILRIGIHWPLYVYSFIEEVNMKPFSWFTDWANKLGIPPWTLYLGAGVLAVLILNFFFGV